MKLLLLYLNLEQDKLLFFSARSDQEEKRRAKERRDRERDAESIQCSVTLSLFSS